MNTKIIEIQNKLSDLDYERDQLISELKSIQDSCNHADLPKRELGEEYSDYCPNCGHHVYCYRIG